MSTTTPESAASRGSLTPAAQVCLVVIATAALIGLTVHAGPVVLGLAVVALGWTLAWGWAGAIGLPSPYGTAAVLGSATVLMVSVVVAGEQTNLTWLPAALGVSVVGTYAHQLLRRDGRPRLIQSVSATLFGLAVIASGVLYIPLAVTRETAYLAAAAAAAAAVSAVVDLLGRWPQLRPWVVPIGLVAGGGVAVAVGVPGGSSWTTYLMVGMTAAAVGLAMRAVFSVLPTMAHVRPRVVSAVASVLVSGGVVFATISLTTGLTSF